MEAGLVSHKKQAQKTLKYHVKKGTLFTLRDTIPQQYYPSTIKSDIVKNKMQRNGPINPTGVVSFQNPYSSKYPIASDLQSIVIQTLEGYVLLLLSTSPLFIHTVSSARLYCVEFFLADRESNLNNPYN